MSGQIPDVGAEDDADYGEEGEDGAGGMGAAGAGLGQYGLNAET